MAMRNVDELLFQDTQERLGKTYEPLEDKEAPQAEIVEEVKHEDSVPESQAEPEVAAEAQEDVKAVADEPQQSTDDYGNEVPKARMYTEEEVNRMMRDRLSRGRWAQEPQPELTTNWQQPQTQDVSQDDSWEAQLEQFIDKTITNRERSQLEKMQQYEEQRRHAEFQDKFVRGMSKYNDYQNVVAQQPITDSMLLATRGMEDPAAFFYAAAKTQAKELERISKINDPYQQGMEIGKLEERMRKAKSMTAAPKPVSKTVGDMSHVKKEVKHSIDSRIMEHARSKTRR